MVIYSHAIDDSLIDDFLPADNENSKTFSSMEIDRKVAKLGKGFKREARPIIDLIMNILDTVNKSAKSDLKYLQNKNSRYTR